MAFVGKDGFWAHCRQPVKSTDTSILLHPEAAAKLATIQAGDYTYLLLEDEVVGEVVKYVGGATTYQARNGVQVPIQRGLNGTIFNLGPRPVLRYGFCTNIVQDVCAAIISKGGL